jgi:hypothetical protein
MNDMDEYNQLSDVDKYYVSKYGWDAYHKKKELETRARIQQPEPVQEVEPEETVQEGISEEDVRAKKLEILERIEESLDEEDEDFSTIPFANLPRELQTELRARAEAMFAEDKKTLVERAKKVDVYLETERKKAEKEIAEFEAQKKKQLIEAFQRDLAIGAQVFHNEAYSHVRDFLAILHAMETDPENNVQWMISLFNTQSNDIVMMFQNLTGQRKPVQGFNPKDPKQALEYEKEKSGQS